MRLKRYLAFLLALVLTFSDTLPALADSIVEKEPAPFELSEDTSEGIYAMPVAEVTTDVTDNDKEVQEETQVISETVSDNDVIEEEIEFENDEDTDVVYDEDATIVESGEEGDVTFSLDSNGLLLVEGTGNFASSYLSYDNRAKVKKAVVKTTGATSAYGMLRNLDNMTEVDLSSFDTSKVTDMVSMFYGCSNLTSLDLSDLNTSSVTDMECMFSCCTSLTNLDVSGFNTSAVTNMCNMFRKCSSLTSLDVSGFNTSAVTNMKCMFCECSGLTSLSLNGFDTSSVTDMSFMFDNCKVLTSLDVSCFDTSNVTNMFQMFNDCRSLTSLDVSKFDTSSVTNMSNMFNYCSSLTGLNLSNWDVSSVQNLQNLFRLCSNLTNLDVSTWVTSSAVNMGGMFQFCSSLTSLDVSKFDTSSVTDMVSMFESCKNLTNLDVSSFKTENVTNMGHMFSLCENLTQADVSKFSTSNVTNMSCMFQSCEKLTGLDVSKFDTSSVSEMDGLFSGCSGLTSLDVSKFDTTNVTAMSRMFSHCSGLTSLDISKFVTTNVTNMSYMFYDCSGLTSLDVSNFDTTNVTNMEHMFLECSGLTSLDLSKFDTTNVTNMDGMFSWCSLLTSLDLSNLDFSSLSKYSYMFYACGQLAQIKTPINLNVTIELPGVMFDNSGKEWNILPQNTSKSITLVSTKMKKDYKFAFDSNVSSIKDYYGGTKTPVVTGKMNALEIKAGSGKALTANAFKVTGYEFVGWNTKADGTGESCEDKAVEPRFSGDEKNVTLYAQWKKSEYKITYAGLTDEMVSAFGLPVKYQIDSDPIKFEDYASLIVYPGCQFKGFYTTNKYSKVYKEISTGTTGNKTVYVKLEGCKYSVIFDINLSNIKDCKTDIKPSGSMKAQKLTCGKDASLSKNAYAVKGYEFVVWNTKDDGTGKAYADKEKVRDLTTEENAQVTLYAQWKKAEYNITYAGLTEEEVEAYNLPTTYHFDDDTISYDSFNTTFSRDGYDFKGSYSNKKYDKKKKMSKIESGSIGNKTVYVKMIPHKYKLTFDLNKSSITDLVGAEPKTGGKMSKQTVKFGEKKAIAKNKFTVRGYKLKGWNTQADGNGTMYADKGEILNLTPDDGAEIKLYAIWEKATYKITYAGLADEEVASFGLPTEYKIDSPVITFADYTASIARTGYKFKGLYKDSKYKSSYKTIATGSTGDKKVYVKMAANKYKIKFVRNEASVSGSPKASGSMKTQTVTYGKTVRLTSNAFKLKGHTFKGWNTEADGSGIPYTNKASISNLTAVDGETITLYAQWE